MRKILVYLKYYWLTVALIIIAVFFWFFIDPNKIDVFKSGLLSSMLGIGIAITFNENRKSMASYKRTKKTFGILKLVAIPYLKSQSENIIDTMKSYDDICDFDKAFAFTLLVSEFNKIIANFDNSWMQLIYSQDFMDTINSDDHFNKIGQQILEIMLFGKTITACSVNAKNLIAGFSISNKTNIEKNYLVQKAKILRNEISISTKNLQKYTDNLNNEIEMFMKRTGIVYSEFER